MGGTGGGWGFRWTGTGYSGWVGSMRSQNGGHDAYGVENRYKWEESFCYLKESEVSG